MPWEPLFISAISGPTSLFSLRHLPTSFAWLTWTFCSKQNVQVNQAKLVGKWRSEKRDVGPLIAEMKRGSHGMPDHMIQPMIDKVKQSAELTEDWEFKA